VRRSGNEPLPNLGAILRQARREAGATQTTLAIRSGIPQPAISRIERGAESPSFERFGHLVSCLGLRPSVDLEPLPYRGDPELLRADARLDPGARLVSGFNTAALARDLRIGALRAERG